MVRLLQPILTADQVLHKRGDEIAWPYDDPPESNIAVDVSDARPNTYL